MADQLQCVFGADQGSHLGMREEWTMLADQLQCIFAYGADQGQLQSSHRSMREGWTVITNQLLMIQTLIQWQCSHLGVQQDLIHQDQCSNLSVQAGRAVG